ncbi:MAG: polysaccharide deacetylase family protein [Acidobacteriota bacterium]
MKRLIGIAILIFFCAQLTISLQKTDDSLHDKPHREVAITFDDLPATHGDVQAMQSITEKLLKSIKANGVPAIGFVNESKLYLDERENPKAIALLRAWLDEGYELGNHTFSHIYIEQASLEEYQKNVIRGEIITRRLLGERGKLLRYFRHTQLRTGPTETYRQGLNQFLKSRGYTIAPVTIDNQDFMFAQVYRDAKQRGDRTTMKRVADAYVPYMENVFEFFENLSHEFLGYEVKQTLLLHANDLNADYLNELAAMLKRRGYRFISLDEALKDKAYQLPEAQHRRGLSWIHRWMLAKGLAMKPEPGEPPFITELFNARTR